MVNMHLNREVERLKKLLLKQSLNIQEAVSKVLTAFTTNDLELAFNVLEDDKKIDFCEVEIEEECLKILALHQPVAGDLRYVITCLKVNNDLERVGDLCCNIAIQCKTIIKNQGLQNGSTKNLELMFKEASRMLNEALESLISANKEKAAEILIADDFVDDLYEKIHHKIIEKIKENHNNVRYYLAIENIARQVERMADYATNICEDVIYMINGEICRHQDK